MKYQRPEIDKIIKESKEKGYIVDEYSTDSSGIPNRVDIHTGKRRWTNGLTIWPDGTATRNDLSDLSLAVKITRISSMRKVLKLSLEEYKGQEYKGQNCYDWK